MFGKKTGKPFGKTISIIGKGVTFEGRIRSDADVWVEGCVIGDVECRGAFVVAEQGAVTADISSCDVVVAGCVTGNVNTTNTLTITETGKMIGDISIEKMVIAQGGVLQGNCKMKGDFQFQESPESEQTLEPEPAELSAEPAKSGKENAPQKLGSPSSVASQA